MIPSDVRLFTWLDVEEVLARVRAEGQWPQFLVWARIYWDGAFFGVRPGAQDATKAWLAQVFDPRFDAVSQSIVLEALPAAPRKLDIIFEETEEDIQINRVVPSFRRPSVLRPPNDTGHPFQLPEQVPPLVLFHSFKGGVGRTLHAFALAALRAGNDKPFRTLLIDGDLEAPGLSWLLRSRVPAPPVSYADFLSLVHSDPDPQAEEALALVAAYLRDSLVDDIFVLPAFRSPSQFQSIEVRPEHLSHGAPDPYRLTVLLSRLGELLNVDLVVVDSRAGLSELSAGLLLDPRVHRVLVTTLTSQSMEGTSLVLDALGRLAPSLRDDEPLPGIIISQVPDNYPDSDLLAAEEQLFSAARRFLGPDQPNLPFVISEFDPTLAVLPDNWDEVVRRIERADFSRRLLPIFEWLPSRRSSSIAAPLNTENNHLPERRKSLSRYAKDLVFAESGEADEFLNTRPLRNLSSNFVSQAPIAVVIGAKGAGKTYTYLQMARRKTWRDFALDAGASEVSFDGVIAPVLQPRNLHPAARAVVQNARENAAAFLGLGRPADSDQINDHIREGLQLNLHEGQWRERWLDVVAWSAGMDAGRLGVGRRFVEFLRETSTPCVATFDGIEDLFQDLLTREEQQIALRSLIQELPEWLEQQPLRPLGIVIVVRQDMVARAVRQNPAQMTSLYEPYALRWGADEALRLVKWIAVKASALNGDPASLLEDDRVDLVEDLEPLWGRKLGSEKSKEARSAEWIIAALSDLRGQIQARDIVRFLADASAESVADTYWKDRLLIPLAIRDAVGKCGKEKVREIAQENIALGNIFLKLEELPIEKKQVPFSVEDIELSADELKTLEDNGAIVRENSEYHMAEVFRVGLDFRLRAGARPRVLTLARRTRKEK